MSKVESPQTAGIICAKDFKVVYEAFTKINNWSDLIKNCDFVIHLAGITHFDLSHLTEEDYQKNNLELSKNIG